MWYETTWAGRLATVAMGISALVVGVFFLAVWHSGLASACRWLGLWLGIYDFWPWWYKALDMVSSFAAGAAGFWMVCWVGEMVVSPWRTAYEGHDFWCPKCGKPL